MVTQLTHAILAASVRLVADVTDATVAPTQVLADTVLTNVWVQSAFVDVYEETECSPLAFSIHKRIAY